MYCNASIQNNISTDSNTSHLNQQACSVLEMGLKLFLFFLQIVHPKYNFFTYEYDLALVKLERRIDFQENIIPICLPGNEDLLVGKTYIDGSRSISVLIQG